MYMRNAGSIFRFVFPAVLLFAAVSLFFMPAVAGAASALDQLNQALADPDRRGCAIRHLRPVQWHDAPVSVTDTVGFVDIDGQTEVVLTYDIFNRLVSAVGEWEGHVIRNTFEFSYTCPYSYIKSMHREILELVRDGEVVARSVYYRREGGNIPDAEHDGEHIIPLFNFDKDAWLGPRPTRACDPTSLPVRTEDEPRTQVEEGGDVEFIIDEYNRIPFMTQKMPFGYIAETSYEYFDETFLYEKYSKPAQCNYIERKRVESGRLLKDGEVRASYRIVFDRDGNIVEQSSEGGRFIRYILTVFAPILGYDLADPEGTEWIDRRFGDS